MKVRIYFSVFSLAAFCYFAVIGNAQVTFSNQDPSKKHFVLSENLKPGDDYLDNTVIFKMKTAYRQNCKINSIDNILPIQDYLNTIGCQGLEKTFPNHTIPAAERNTVGLPLVDLTLIYSFRYSSNASLEDVINKLRSSGYFEYVEPWYIPKPLSFTPNDNANQYYLQGNVIGSLNTEDGWDLTKGDTTVVIGIVDTGIKPHPDLDGNYVGGYDVGMNDPDPSCEGSSYHGLDISGAAAAVTNNGIGIASPGFNCKFKAIKVTDTTGYLIKAYPGIVWAADNGCKIINCSWGNAQNSAYEQNIIDYAVINKNCLVICSAGNGSVEEFIYPGSYNNAFRVASTTNTDAKSSFSSYGCDIDFSSPGSGIWTTIPSSYGPIDGTSMSSAIASSAAALVESFFHYPNAQQIGEKLKNTCDPYTGAPTLSLFNAGMLGKGRIDVYNALVQPAKSLVMNPINITDGNDTIFMPGETLSISGTFINYLDPSSASATAVLSIVSGPATIVNGNYSIGALATLATKTMTTPFTANVDITAGVNAVIRFKVTITDGAYTSTQCFDVIVNPNSNGIPSNDVAPQVTVYPNPTNDLVTISYPGHISEMSVTDVFGQLSYRTTKVVSGKNVINLSSAPSGIYFLQVRTKNGVATKKIIKN